MDWESCLTVTTQGHVQVAAFTRNIFDAELLEAVHARLLALVAQAEQPRLVMDFSGLRHVGSNFLGMVMDITLKVGRKGGRMGVCGMSPALRDLFALMRLDQMVPIHETLDAALADLAA